MFADRNVRLVLSGNSWDKYSSLMAWSSRTATADDVIAWATAVLQVTFAQAHDLYWDGVQVNWTPPVHAVDEKAVSFLKWRFPVILNGQLESISVPFANFLLLAGPTWPQPWTAVLDAFERLVGVRPATPSLSLQSKRLAAPVIYPASK